MMVKAGEVLVFREFRIQTLELEPSFQNKTGFKAPTPKLTTLPLIARSLPNCSSIQELIINKKEIKIYVIVVLCTTFRFTFNMI